MGRECGIMKAAAREDNPRQKPVAAERDSGKNGDSGVPRDSGKTSEKPRKNREKPRGKRERERAYAKDVEKNSGSGVEPQLVAGVGADGSICSGGREVRCFF